MNFKIIRSETLEEENYGDTRVTNIYNNFGELSLAKVRKTGDDIKEGYDTESDVLYYVLEGEGKCVINGEEHILRKGDLVHYCKGTSYKHLSGLTLLAISIPSFDRKKRVYVEN